MIDCSGYRSPLLVIHGAQDQHVSHLTDTQFCVLDALQVPVGNGEELYEHATTIVLF